MDRGSTSITLISSNYSEIMFVAGRYSDDAMGLTSTVLPIKSKDNHTYLCPTPDNSGGYRIPNDRIGSNDPQLAYANCWNAVFIAKDDGTNNSYGISIKITTNIVNDRLNVIGDWGDGYLYAVFVR